MPQIPLLSADSVPAMFTLGVKLGEPPRGRTLTSLRALNNKGELICSWEGDWFGVMQDYLPSFAQAVMEAYLYGQGFDAIRKVAHSVRQAALKGNREWVASGRPS